jgi:purine-cytosine permease-like protein
MTATIEGRTELSRPLKIPFEEHGIGTIPEEDRRVTPWDFFLTFTGTGFTPGTLVFGWIPIAFGLSFWATMSSMIVGVLAALPLIAALMVISTQTATNGATSSGAHFGVRGRLIGSGIGLALVLLGMVIAIWSSGQLLVAGAGRVFHASTGNGSLAIAYVLLTVLSAAVGVWGIHLVIRVNAALAIFGVVTVLLMLAAFAGHLNPGYRGGSYVLGGFDATWWLAVFAVGLGGVMTMATLVGDPARYVSASRYPPSRFLPLALLAVVVSYVVPMGIGALIATTFRHPETIIPANLAAASPGWFAWILIFMALLGNLGWSGWSVYSLGLDLKTILPRVTRARLTVVMSALTVAVVIAGSLVWDASNTLSTGSSIMLAISAPWAAIIGIGYLRCHGRYDKADLQVFNRREKRRGRYWYTGGWSLPAVAAWIAGCAFGVLTVQTTLYTGPFSNIASGPDVSFVGSFIIAGLLYVLLETAGARRTRRTARPALAREGTGQ